jgi:hypothetical protein
MANHAMGKSSRTGAIRRAAAERSSDGGCRRHGVARRVLAFCLDWPRIASAGFADRATRRLGFLSLRAKSHVCGGGVGHCGTSPLVLELRLVDLCARHRSAVPSVCVDLRRAGVATAIWRVIQRLLPARPPMAATAACVGKSIVAGQRSTVVHGSKFEVEVSGSSFFSVTFSVGRS